MPERQTPDRRAEIATQEGFLLGIVIDQCNAFKIESGSHSDHFVDIALNVHSMI